MKFRSDPSSVRGSIAPIVTPFTAEGDVDHDSLRSLVRWQLASGSHGVSIGGSTGEPSSQTVAERIAAMAVVAEETADRVPFVPGTGSAKLDETLEMTEAAIDLGADIALVITPYYSRPTQDGLYAVVLGGRPRVPRHADRALQRADPHRRRRRPRDGRPAAPRLTTTSSASRRPPRTSSTSRASFHLCGRDLLMWSGIELLCLPLLALGGIGFVSAVANIAPAGRGRDVRALGRRRPRSGARAALRAAPAGRPDVRRDQPGADQARARSAAA